MTACLSTAARGARGQLGRMVSVLRRTFFGGLAAAAAGLTAWVAAYLWPRRAASAAEFDAGPVEEFSVGQVRHFQVNRRDAPADQVPLADSRRTEARDFHLVRRPDGFVAFWHRCTHLGCTVPFRPEFEFRVRDRMERGLFRCPCHGATFSRDEAEVVFGPAPRPLDALPVRVRDGRVIVTVREGAERRRQAHELAPMAPA